MAFLAKISRRSPGDVLLAAEALVLLAVFRVCLAFVPVRRILRTITRGLSSATPDPQAAILDQRGTDRISDSVLEQALRVRWAVEAATRNSAAKFVCFPQTLAGYTMLRRRAVASTMVYGVARSAEGELIAHTWLVIGDRILLGGEGSGAFSEIERWI